MTPREAASVIAAMKANWRRTMSDTDVEFWMHQLEPMDFNVVREAFDELAHDTERFDGFPTVADLTKAISGLRRSSHRAIDSKRVCNGDAWIIPSERPCPKCNPWLAKVYADPVLFDRYRHARDGREPWRITGEESEKAWRDEWSRPRCKPLPDEYDNPATARPAEVF